MNYLFFAVLGTISLGSGWGAELNLPGCLDLAKKHSVEMSQGRLSVDQAAASYREAGTARLPQLSGRAAYDKSDDPSTQLPDANNALLHLEQPLSPLSPEWQLARQRKIELSAVDMERLQTERDVEHRVRQLYFGILQGRQTIDHLNEVQAELNKLLTAVLPRYTMGRAPPFDLIKVKSAIADLDKSRGDQTAQLVSQSAELAQRLGYGATAQLDLEMLSTKPPIPSNEEVQRLIESNPGLKALAERISAARIGIATAQYSRIPSLVGSGEYGYSGQTPTTTSKGWDVALALRLPLFDWGAISSRVAQERASTGLAQSRFDLERQAFLAQALGTRAKAQSDLARSERMKQLLPDLRQAAIVSIERYRRGAATILEATEAMSLWLQALLDQRAAYYAYLSDLADISWLGGQEPGSDGL